MLIDPRNMNADAMEEELMKMWGMISELSEQMQNNRHLANTLQNQASQLRVCLTLILFFEALGALLASQF
jgi:hypothetical protein